jgi:hypothetical protein
MARYVWLLSGGPQALDRPLNQRRGHIIAVCADTIPLMWLPMFGLGDMVCQLRSMGDSANRICLRTDKEQAVASLKRSIHYLAVSAKADQSLSCMAELLCKVVLRAPGPLVEADLTEVALIDDLDDFTLGLASFLEWLRNDDQASSRGLPPRDAARFIRNNCKICETALPTDAELQHPETMSSQTMLVTGHLLGSSWEKPVPWEAR